MWFTSARQHFPTTRARIVIHLLRRWLEMGFGIKALIVRRQVNARGFDNAQTAPFAVAIDAEHLGDGLLRAKQASGLLGQPDPDLDA